MQPIVSLLCDQKSTSSAWRPWYMKRIDNDTLLPLLALSWWSTPQDSRHTITHIDKQTLIQTNRYPYRQTQIPIQTNTDTHTKPHTRQPPVEGQNGSFLVVCLVALGDVGFKHCQHPHHPVGLLQHHGVVFVPHLLPSLHLLAHLPTLPISSRVGGA